MPHDLAVPFALIVEDHPLVADSLVACVRDCDAELVVEMAESLASALRILELRPGPILIVTDLTLPDTSGTESVRSLRKAAPRSPLLVFTALDDPQLRKEALELGAVRYLVKSTSIRTLRKEMRALIGRRGGVGESISRPLATLNALLSPKQISVLEELAAGRSNKEIASRLNISSDTVGSHMKEIFGRLAVRNRTEAVVRYLELINLRVARPAL